MIDETVFKNTWTLLCERFGKEPSRLMMKAYYRSLTNRMETVEFQAAASRLFDSAEFFPRPDDFLPDEATDEASALEAWEGVHRLMRGFCSTDELDPEARRVVRLMGGERKLRNTPLDQVQWVRRDFLKLYGDAVAIAGRENGRRIEPTPEGRRITEELVGPKLLDDPDDT